MAGGAAELQKLVNLEARAVTGCFRTTNQAALGNEAGLRPAVAQLNNRQRRFGARLLALPRGDEARKIVGAPSGIGRRLEEALGYSGRMEETITLPLAANRLELETIVEEKEEAKRTAGRERAGLTIFTDGSRARNGATGYAVTWKSRSKWVGVKTHLGYNQEAFDAECAALARALEVAARRRSAPEAVTIYTDAQAAMRRIVADEPGPGQKYAVLARKWVAALKQTRPEVRIEIRWCPAHEGVEGNEKADEWAKQAAEEPDARGVEWLRYGDRYGVRRMPPPRSLANLKREIAEKKWGEARSWTEERIRGRKYRLARDQRPNWMVERAPKHLAGRFHQLRTGHCRTGQYLEWTKNADSAACGWCQYRTQTREHLFKHCRKWKRQQKVLWAEVRKETGKGKDRHAIRDLFADERCTGAILDFLRTTEVGSRVGPRTKATVAGVG